MNKIKIQLFFAKNSKWIYPFLILISIILVAYLFNKFSLAEEIRSWSNNTIAVIGTLFGAIIGGIFTLLGSIYVHKKQLQAQTQIKRKNLIYKPLYDEISAIQKYILSINPFPRRIEFKTCNNDFTQDPHYTVWDRIKADTRYLETPTHLISEMETLYSKIKEYTQVRSACNKEISSLINNIFQEVLRTQISIFYTDNILDSILKDEVKDIYESYRYDLKGHLDVSEEQQKKINTLFHKRCKDSPAILKIKKAQLDWDVQQKKVISILTDLIKYINIKYEG